MSNPANEDLGTPWGMTSGIFICGDSNTAHSYVLQLMMQSSLRRSISHNNLEETERAKKAVQLNYVRGGNPPYFKNACGWTSLVVPNIHGHSRSEKKFISDELFDKYTLTELEKCGALNWCPGVAAMMPLHTSGDGNCLMHAASLFMWGYHDRRLELRRAVYDALVKGVRGQICERWRKFREHHNKNCSNSMQVSFDSTTWDAEWMQVVDVACPRSFDQRFESLEELHIFVLANVLRRPIVVLSQHTLYSVTGEAFQPVTMGGIYLPLLCDSLNCCKTPIVIGFANGHFAPLVFVSEEIQELQQAVPLVTPQFQPLEVHFTIQHENAQNLLSEYLEVTELDVPSSSGHHKTINAAAFFPHAPPHQHIVDDYVTHLLEQFQLQQTQEAVGPAPLGQQAGQMRQIPSAPAPNEDQQLGGPQSLIHDQFPEIHRYQCRTQGCPNFGSKERNFLCSECSQQSRLLQKVQSSPPISPGTQRLIGPPLQGVPCTTPRCPRPADPRLGGRKCADCHDLVAVEERRRVATGRFGNDPLPEPRTTKVVYPAGGNLSAEVRQLQEAQGQHCCTPGCTYFADPHHGNRCSSCFERVTLEEIRREEIRSSQQGGRAPHSAFQNLPVDKVSNPERGINAEIFLGLSPDPQGQLQQKQTTVLKPFSREVPDQLCKCRGGGCTNTGSSHDYGYCSTCFAKEVESYHERSQRGGQTSSAPVRSNSSMQLSALSQVEVPPRSLSGPVDMRTTQSSKQCRTPDCAFFGNAHLNGYCSGCSKKALRASEPKPTERKPEVPARTRISELPPPRPPKPLASSPAEDIYNQIPCKKVGCPRLTPKDSPSGLCERCLRQNQNGQSTPILPPPVVEPQTQQPATKPVSAIPGSLCRVQGCTFFGDHRYSGYCSLHYWSHGPAAHDSCGRRQPLANGPSNFK